MTALIIVGIVVVLVLLYFVSTQRSLVNLDEMCKNALSQIEVQLNSRFDAVIALAKTAAQYAKHESDTIIQAVQARGGNGGNAPATLNEQSDLLGQVMSRLNVVVERYPELKASDLYREAQEGQKEFEEKVRLSRMVYNDSATKMNRMVRQWPSSIVASMLHFAEKDYLKVDEAKKTAYPDLDDAFRK